jgi:hypothetical protein
MNEAGHSMHSEKAPRYPRGMTDEMVAAQGRFLELWNGCGTEPVAITRN